MWPSTLTCGTRRRWRPRDVANFDLYSCFGSSLNFARDALGVPADDPRAVTVTGGLPYHGGPASNYMGHAIATMAQTLRADPGAWGLVSGVGMHMTKHVFGVYSTEPGPVTAPEAAAIQAHLDAHPLPNVLPKHDGAATVAAYCVAHGRDGEPESAVLVCDVGPGARTYANITDVSILASAEHEELVGRRVRLTPTEVPLAGGDGNTTRNIAHLD
jgi:acetyl-CoA C-acetyltransferase